MQYFHSAQNSLRAAAGNITLALNTKGAKYTCELYPMIEV